MMNVINTTLFGTSPPILCPQKCAPRPLIHWMCSKVKFKTNIAKQFELNVYLYSSFGENYYLIWAVLVNPFPSGKPNLLKTLLR